MTWLQVTLFNSIKHKSFVDTQLDDQTVLFRVNQFSNGNEGVLHILKTPALLEPNHQIV